MKRGLSGYIPIRNGDLLDYCWRVAVESLLPVCDEVVICDGGSTDGTLDAIQAWAAREPKIRVIHYDWPDPVGDIKCIVKWLNYTRERLEYDMQLFTVGDEVIDPNGYKEIRNAVAQKECRWFRRLNFWQDAHHLAPENTVCGTMVAQLGPTEFFMPADDLYNPEPPIRALATFHDSLKIFHYGFIRKQDAFFRKSRVMQRAIMNMYDPRLDKAEREGLDWVKECPFIPAGQTKAIPLENYPGRHPKIAHEWLKERGYDPR